jgi:hypothetical protein
MKIQQPRKTTPWLFLIGIFAVLTILARTDLLQSTMNFIQTDQVNNWQIIACIIFSIVGLWVTFVLLNIISKFYINKLEQVTGNSTGSLSNHSTNHGGEKQ